MAAFPARTHLTARQYHSPKAAAVPIEDAERVIDYFSIALTHGLILFALWRLMPREELDVEGAPAEKPLRPWLKGEEAEGEAPDA